MVDEAPQNMNRSSRRENISGRSQSNHRVPQPPPFPVLRGSLFRDPVQELGEPTTLVSVQDKEKKPSQPEPQPRNRVICRMLDPASCMSEECRQWFVNVRRPTKHPDQAAHEITPSGLLEQFRKNSIFNQVGLGTASTSGSETDDGWNYEASVRTEEMMRVNLPRETREVMEKLTPEQRREVCSRCAQPGRQIGGPRGDNTDQNAIHRRCENPAAAPSLHVSKHQPQHAERPLVTASASISSPTAHHHQNSRVAIERELPGACHRMSKVMCVRMPRRGRRSTVVNWRADMCVCERGGAPCPVYGRHRSVPLLGPPKAATALHRSHTECRISRYLNRARRGQRVCSSCRQEQQFYDPFGTQPGEDEVVEVRQEVTSYFGKTPPGLPWFRNVRQPQRRLLRSQELSIQRHTSATRPTPPSMLHHGMRARWNCHSATGCNNGNAMFLHCRACERCHP